MYLSIYIHERLIKLKEVDSDEEAFYEMRRYMTVNGICSDTTTLRKDSYADRFGKSEEIKCVYMHSGYHNQDDLVFAIHNLTRPEYDSLEDAINGNSYIAYCFDKYQNEKEKYSPGNSLQFPRLRSNNTHTTSWFPDELALYADDLTRRGGDVYCH